MNQTRLLLLAALAGAPLVCWCSPAIGQPPAPVDEPSTVVSPDGLLILTDEFIRDDQEVRDAFQQMLIARFEREQQILSERRNVIGWTNWISRFIFVVIHVVLAIGLWAAMREFIDAGRTRKRSPPPITTAVTGEQAQAAREQNELSISLQGIALKTSLHGLLILAAAIGFYFLYLKFVYPITVIGG